MSDTQLDNGSFNSALLRNSSINPTMAKFLGDAFDDDEEYVSPAQAPSKARLRAGTTAPSGVPAMPLSVNDSPPKTRTRGVTLAPTAGDSPPGRMTRPRNNTLRQFVSDIFDDDSTSLVPSQTPLSPTTTATTDGNTSPTTRARGGSVNINATETGLKQMATWADDLFGSSSVVDTTGDGVGDTIYVDTTGDGVPDTIARPVDSTGDGLADSLVVNGEVMSPVQKATGRGFAAAAATGGGGVEHKREVADALAKVKAARLAKQKQKADAGAAAAAADDKAVNRFLSAPPPRRQKSAPPAAVQAPPKRLSIDAVDVHSECTASPMHSPQAGAQAVRLRSMHVDPSRQ